MHRARSSAKSWADVPGQRTRALAVMEPSITSYLVPKLPATFRAGSFRISEASPPVVVFHAIHPAVGDVVVHDDGDEVTVECGNFTHTHFANYDDGIDNAERAKRIADAVLGFLRDLFADQIELYGSHKSGGGWRRVSRGPLERESTSLFGGQSYVWSGPKSK